MFQDLDRQDEVHRGFWAPLAGIGHYIHPGSVLEVDDEVGAAGEQEAGRPIHIAAAGVEDSVGRRHEPLSSTGHER
jgi:hypothetical protein